MLRARLRDEIAAVRRLLDVDWTRQKPKRRRLPNKWADALETALDALERTHVGGRHDEAYPYPSIRDAARFQFARMLVSVCRSPSTKSPEQRNDIAKMCGRPDDVWHDVPKFLTSLGGSAIGQSVRNWWRNSQQCYEWEKERDWIDLRHRSFKAVRSLARSIAKVTPRQVSAGKTSSRGSWLGSMSAALNAAKNAEQDVAQRVRKLVRTLTDWCPSRGQQLLLADRVGPTGAADPNEIAAGLWIADRIGEQWEGRLEEAALEMISGLQRPDGSFPAVAPLYQNRGFTFFPPSASTIATLARFVTAGPQAPDTPTLRARLERWADVLENGARFLEETMVGRDLVTPRPVGHQPLAGWHSDRHPEAERIDCLATCEAVTALCRLDDAIKWLINLRATTEFRLDWPQRVWHSAQPLDCAETTDKPLLVRVGALIRQHQLRSALYTEDPAAGADDDTGHNVFLLYGPPGTGKTFLLESIAGELRWPLLTLTMGDFLRDGGDRIGHRAEEIFDRLCLLSNVCIVFDEFDEMIQVRHGTGLPLLTATMLPLLSRLREHAEREACLISVTTNFRDMIDEAAIRGGRVDDPILMMYPDYPSRLLYGILRTKQGTAVNWTRVRTAAEEAWPCAYPHFKSHMNRRLDAAADTSSIPKPRKAIDLHYYSRGHVDLEELKRLVASAGPTNKHNKWAETLLKATLRRRASRATTLQGHSPRSLFDRTTTAPNGDQ